MYIRDFLTRYLIYYEFTLQMKWRKSYNFFQEIKRSSEIATRDRSRVSVHSRPFGFSVVLLQPEILWKHFGKSWALISLLVLHTHTALQQWFLAKFPTTFFKKKNFETWCPTPIDNKHCLLSIFILCAGHFLMHACILNSNSKEFSWFGMVFSVLLSFWESHNMSKKVT